MDWMAELLRRGIAWGSKRHGYFDEEQRLGREARRGGDKDRGALYDIRCRPDQRQSPGRVDSSHGSRRPSLPSLLGTHEF